jgi:glycosyltransferase involved in cell wall biosynthesis
MQILEAMACHIPVLTGRNSSLPEVGGDAALYVDEQSVDAISKGIVKIIEDEKLRRSLVAKGKQQIQKFSWQQSAQTIIDKVYS